jgi:hypothetical protein
MLKETLNAQLPKIKNLIYLSESGFYDNVNVELADWEVNNSKDRKLVTVILTIILTVYADEDFSSMVSLLDDIETKIHRTLDRVAFNQEGLLTRPDGNETVTFTGGVLLHKLHFSTMILNLIILENWILHEKVVDFRHPLFGLLYAALYIAS